jgi:aryl-alcohol dehydrogenase-like predicted oxidoreductase
MEYRKLGRTGLEVSRLILGALGFGSKGWREWAFEERESFAILARAVDRGITTFDTCDFYSAGESERILGKLVKQNLAREAVVIATKLGNPMRPDPNGGGYSRKYIKAAVEESLRRLGTDYIDLYQTHIWDRGANIEEMVLAFDDLVREGKVLYLGITDMPAWQLAKALFTADSGGHARFASVQNHFNLIYREDERELVPLTRDQGMGWIPYSPMGRDFLCGTRRRAGWGETPWARTDDFAQKLYFWEADFEVAARVEKVARDRGLAPAQIALMWVLGQPGLTAPVIGATDPAHIDAAVAVLDERLTPEECAYLQEAYAPRPLPAPVR